MIPIQATFTTPITDAHPLRFAVLLPMLFATLVFLNGCVAAGKEAPKVAEIVLKATEDAVKANGKRTVAVGTEDLVRAGKVSDVIPKAVDIGNAYGADVVVKERYFEVLESPISKTRAAANMSKSQLQQTWNSNPQFRIEAVGQVAERAPDALGALADEPRSPGHRLSHVGQRLANPNSYSDEPLVSKNEVISTMVADSSKDISLHSGAAMNPTGIAEARKAFKEKLENIVGQVLEDLPKDIAEPTDAQLKAAISKALKREPNWTYSFDGESGKLTFKWKFGNGEFSQPIPIYKILYISGIGTSITKKDDLVRLAKAYFAESDGQNGTVKAHP